MNRISRALNFASEQVFTVWNAATSFTGLRSTFRAISNRFWAVGGRPRYEGTIVSYTKARELYRNFGPQSLGSGFCRPIVNLQVSFMGIPTASTDDDEIDDYLNSCLHIYWADEIQQMITAAIRDSKTFVLFHKPDIFDPLMTMDEAQHGSLEIIPPELVEVERNPRNQRIIERVIIQRRWIVVEDEGDPKAGRDPQTKEIDVLEIITREDYTYWNKTENEPMPEMAAKNPWNFVPGLEVFNEFDATLQGGQSDLECVLPFIEALNDLLVQGLEAHKYHSTPKLKIKVKAVEPYIKNNFPQMLDEDGNIKPNSKISWSGKEILWFTDEEDAEFLEAESVLGDTKQLAEFVIDLICIAAETPEWAFMRVDSGSANSDRNAQTVPFVKKIGRKRNNFTKPIQELLKMALVISGEIPHRPKLTWEPIRADDQLIEMQALQQLIMGLEVAAQRGEISDETYRKMIRMFIPMMKNPTEEARQAKMNFRPEMNGTGDAENVPVLAGPQGQNE